MTLPRQVVSGWTYMISRRCSQRQFFLRPLPHQLRQLDPEHIVDGGEGVARRGKGVGEVLPHADLLRTLPGAEDDAYHRTTWAPHVKPAPNATSRISIPGLSRPSCSACASASGIEAADVLP